MSGNENNCLGIAHRYLCLEINPHVSAGNVEKKKAKTASEIGQLITQHLEKPRFISLFWKIFILFTAKEKKECNKGD